MGTTKLSVFFSQIHWSFNLIEFISIVYEGMRTLWRQVNSLRNNNAYFFLHGELFRARYKFGTRYVSHRESIIAVVKPRRAPKGRFHSYSRRETNRSKKRFDDRRFIPDAFVTTRGPAQPESDSGSNAIPKRDRIAEYENREKRTRPRVPLFAPPSAIYEGSREFMCAQGDVYGSRVPTHGV